MTHTEEVHVDIRGIGLPAVQVTKSRLVVLVFEPFLNTWRRDYRLRKREPIYASPVSYAHFACLTGSDNSGQLAIGSIDFGAAIA
jgi:hypothetical protein